MDFPTVMKKINQCYERSGCSYKQPGVECEMDETMMECEHNVNELIIVQFEDCMKSKYPEFKSGDSLRARDGSHIIEGAGTKFAVDLAQYCDGDKDKTRNLEQCLKELHDQTQPSKDEVRPYYDSMCKVEETCKDKLGTCGEKMKIKTKSTCECNKMVVKNIAKLIQSEKMCVNITTPTAPPPEFDCNVQMTPSLRCEENFDKFYERNFEWIRRLTPTALNRKTRSCNNRHSFYTQFK
jgi:hypothetical protein